MNNGDCSNKHSTLLQDIITHRTIAVTMGWRKSRGIHSRDDKIKKLQASNENQKK